MRTNCNEIQFKIWQFQSNSSAEILCNYSIDIGYIESYNCPSAGEIPLDVGKIDLRQTAWNGEKYPNNACLLHNAL